MAQHSHKVGKGQRPVRPTPSRRSRIESALGLALAAAIAMAGSALISPALVSPALASPVVAEPPTLLETQRACMRDAAWPQVNSNAYRNADARTKVKLRNASHPEVRKMESVCRTLTSTSETERREATRKCERLLAQKRKRTEPAAVEHTQRIQTYCDSVRVP